MDRKGTALAELALSLLQSKLYRSAMNKKQCIFFFVCTYLHTLTCIHIHKDNTISSKITQEIKKPSFRPVKDHYIATVWQVLCVYLAHQQPRSSLLFISFFLLLFLLLLLHF